MISRPVYEALPVSYIIIGATSLLTFEQGYAIASAIVIFVIGANIYNMRSHNRRTDPIKKRKYGGMPISTYNFAPFLYLLLAILIFKFYPSDLTPAISIGFMAYSLFILFKRSSNRRHRTPKAPVYNRF